MADKRKTVRSSDRAREVWLMRATRSLAPMVNAACKATGNTEQDGYPRDTAVSVTYSARSGKGVDALGLCVRPEGHADGASRSIFISSSLSDPVEILSTLLHEMVHAALPSGVAHKRPFAQVCAELGMQGKPTCAGAAPGTPLWEHLKELSIKLGPYPHVAIVKVIKETGGGKQSKWTRLYSTEIPGYSAVVSAKMLEEHGVPRCPMGEPMVTREELG